MSTRPIPPSTVCVHRSVRSNRRTSSLEVLALSLTVALHTVIAERPEDTQLARPISLLQGGDALNATDGHALTATNSHRFWPFTSSKKKKDEGEGATPAGWSDEDEPPAEAFSSDGDDVVPDEIPEACDCPNHNQESNVMCEKPSSWKFWAKKVTCPSKGPHWECGKPMKDRGHVTSGQLGQCKCKTGYCLVGANGDLPGYCVPMDLCPSKKLANDFNTHNCEDGAVGTCRWRGCDKSKGATYCYKDEAGKFGRPGTDICKCTGTYFCWNDNLQSCIPTNSYAFREWDGLNVAENVSKDECKLKTKKKCNKKTKDCRDVEGSFCNTDIGFCMCKESFCWNADKDHHAGGRCDGQKTDSQNYGNGTGDGFNEANGQWPESEDEHSGDNAKSSDDGREHSGNNRNYDDDRQNVDGERSSNRDKHQKNDKLDQYGNDYRDRSQDKHQKNDKLHHNGNEYRDRSQDKQHRNDWLGSRIGRKLEEADDDRREPSGGDRSENDDQYEDEPDRGGKYDDRQHNNQGSWKPSSKGQNGQDPTVQKPWDVGYEEPSSKGQNGQDSMEKKPSSKGKKHREKNPWDRDYTEG